MSVRSLLRVFEARRGLASKEYELLTNHQCSFHLTDIGHCVWEKSLKTIVSDTAGTAAMFLS